MTYQLELSNLYGTDKARLNDSATEYVETGHAVTADLTYTWGRTSFIDNPQPATLKFTEAINDQPKAVEILQNQEPIQLTNSDNNTNNYTRTVNLAQDYMLTNIFMSPDQLDGQEWRIPSKYNEPEIYVVPDYAVSGLIQYEPFQLATDGKITITAQISYRTLAPSAPHPTLTLGYLSSFGDGSGKLPLYPDTEQIPETGAGTYQYTSQVRHNSQPVVNIKVPQETWNSFENLETSWDDSALRWGMVNSINADETTVSFDYPRNRELLLYQGGYAAISTSTTDSHVITGDYETVDLLAVIANYYPNYGVIGGCPLSHLIYQINESLADLMLDGQHLYASVEVPVFWLGDLINTYIAHTDTSGMSMLEILQNLAKTIGATLWPFATYLAEPQLLIMSSDYQTPSATITVTDGNLVIDRNFQFNITEIPASHILADGIQIQTQFESQATQAIVTWRETSIDSEHKIVSTEHTVTVGTPGGATINIDTWCGNAESAKICGETWLRSATQDTWTMRGVKVSYPPDSELPFIFDIRGRANALIQITGLPEWVPGESTQLFRIESGTGTHSKNGWQFDLVVSRPNPNGISAMWGEITNLEAFTYVGAQAARWSDFNGAKTVTI